jgi:porin
VVSGVVALLLQSASVDLACSLPGLAEVASVNSGGASDPSPKAQSSEVGPPVLNQQSIGIPASPAAVNTKPGTGALGRWLGLSADSPWRLGGVWAANATAQLGGGSFTPGGLGGAQQLLLDLSLDLDRSIGWKGAKIWVQGLQVNANQAAANASGSLQGSNSLVAPQPLDRTELYSYAFSQYLFDRQVRLFVGKLAPSNDFANVVVPVDEDFGSPYWIPGVSSLTYTPLYAMPTLQGRLPGYPNSAFGASLLLQPNAFNRDVYLKLGVFDGRSGSGVEPSVQTGLALPSVAGPIFSIGEIGGSWLMGNRRMPGAAGFGLWHQGGPLDYGDASDSSSEASAAGGYLIAQQRLIDFRYPFDNSGISAFVQMGWSPSRSNIYSTSVGGGLTVFAPMKSRPLDSYGIGLSWAQINDQGALGVMANPDELMVQVYGQIHLVSNLYLTPSVTVLPVPGVRGAQAPSTSALLQLVALF